jgi:hypothetical protein
MTVDRETYRAARRRNRQAVYAGSAVTAVSTLVLFVLPDLLPVAAITDWYFGLTGEVIHGNPFGPLRLFGGVVGGFVAGWLTPELGSGLVAGLKAGLYGLVGAYLLAVLFYTGYSVVVGSFPPPLLTITSVPLIYGIPMFGTHLVGGAIMGAVGARVG